VSTWNALSDKPTVLTPPGFSAGNFPSAEQLASADIASALSHNPGLSGGIQTTVRASATDDALITEQAVAEKLEVAQEDRELISSRLIQTQADIDALDAVTVRRSRELVGGQGIQPLGDLSEDRTVAVDSTVARTDRDETFTGSVTIEQDLLVKGDEVVQNVETVEIEDHLLFLNAGETNSGVLTGEFGIEGDRGSDPPVKLKYAEATNAARVGVDYKALNHSGAAFQFNEVVFGQSSGAEGIVWQNQNGTARLKGRTGSFSVGETIVGQQSGASASINSITEVDQTQALATREDAPTPSGVPFWNDSLTRFDTDATLTYDGDRVRSTGYQSGSSFVPGFSGSGFAVDETIDGKPDAMHLSHLDVRGTLTVRELILKQITVEKGPNIISPGGGKVEDISTSSHTAVSNVFSSTTQQEWSFTDQTDDPLKHGLAVGDRLLAQRFDPDSQTVVAQVRAVVDVVPDPTTVKVTLDASFTTPATGKDLEGYAFAVVASSDPGRDSLIYQTPYGPYDDYLDGLSDFNDWDNRADFIEARVGNISGASTDIDAGTHGLYGESVRLTKDVIAGDIAAAKAPDTKAGDFLRFDANGLFARIGGTKIRAMQDDIKLLAQRIVQERESRAGLEITASETEAEVRAQAEVIGDTSFASSSLTAFASTTESRFNANVVFRDEGQINSQAALSLEANSDGSTAILSGDSIELNGNTIVDGNFTVSGDTVTLNASTTVNSDFQVTGSRVQLDADTVVNANFQVTGSRVQLDANTVIDGTFTVSGSAVTLNADTLIDGTLIVSDNPSTDNSELRLDPVTPAQEIVEDGDTVAVFTAETSPSYSPTQTSDVLDTSPDSTGVNSYSLSGTGIWLSFSADVTNGAPDSQTVGAELRDASTGNVVADPTSIAFSGEQVSVGAVVQVDGLTSIEVERINTSATLDEVSVEVYKPLTVISREGVKVYKTPNSVKTLT
jgi:hypothetical protein